ncbi:hypothetical protein CC78DRAFT_541395 [Lojkania enalia]|uniref:Uncharacterized protein n=1 Tax=Lojkania enalia TaxID=147567 RepID=A0A9P4KFP7_9PLEO|nr:hypothetical protein CC78DRAFT_541395 [Didymosphaeria enalia]
MDSNDFRSRLLPSSLLPPPPPPPPLLLLKVCSSSSSRAGFVGHTTLDPVSSTPPPMQPSSQQPLLISATLRPLPLTITLISLPIATAGLQELHLQHTIKAVTNDKEREVVVVVVVMVDYSPTTLPFHFPFASLRTTVSPLPLLAHNPHLGDKGRELGKKSRQVKDEKTLVAERERRRKKSHMRKELATILGYY